MIRGKMIECKCAVCGEKFMARVADRNRGWAKCCSKSCAATLNNRKAGNYARFCHKRAVAIAIENGDYIPDYEGCGGFDNTSCQNED